MSYHVCVAGHYLRVGRGAAAEKKSEIQIKQPPEIMQKPRELPVYQKRHSKLLIS